MPDRWDSLRSSLTALLAVCEQEQQALVALDGERLTRLEVDKANLVSQVAHDPNAGKTADASAPPDVTALAERCRRLNQANRKMLILTLQCMEGLMTAAGRTRARQYGASAEIPLRRQVMDLRV